MRIVLIRHCDVDERYHKCYNGHIDIGLSEKGKREAERLARKFHKEEFELVYSSDLLRAKETLKPFKQAKDAIYTERLREKSWGRHEGKSFNEIVAEDGLVYKNFEQWIDALDGEPYREYIERVRSFFLEYLPLQSVERVLVVTHAGVIRILMAIVQNLSLEDAFSIEIPYASHVVFDTKKQTFSIIK